MIILIRGNATTREQVWKTIDDLQRDPYTTGLSLLSKMADKLLFRLINFKFFVELLSTYVVFLPDQKLDPKPVSFLNSEMVSLKKLPILLWLGTDIGSVVKIRYGEFLNNYR